MDLISKQSVKSLLKKHNIKPSRSLGQNFLIDKRAIKRIVGSADLNSEDVVLEIGPGLGSLTQEIAKRAGKVVAIEKDSKMMDILKETLRDFENIEIVREDILKTDAKSCVLNASYKIVGNLPFYLTAPVIRKFLENNNPPELMALVVQKEVGQRICAKPGKMSILAVSVQFYAKPEIISYVSKRSFWPQPKVDSAIIKIVPFDGRRLKSTELSTQDFFKVVKAGFCQPRKQIINNLTKKLELNRAEAEKWLSKNNIDPAQRAETLSVEDWIKLTKSFRMD